MEYLHKDAELFAQSLAVSVRKTGRQPEIIEKDYYVTMILKGLASHFDAAVFKGGTSLSKCYQAINRFSEDIDITSDRSLSQGERKKLKDAIILIAEEMGLTIVNIETIKSRMDYNRYEIAYRPSDSHADTAVTSTVLLETSFAEYSFPVVTLPVRSYLGDLFADEAPAQIERYGLAPFSMRVQSLERTLIDKVFALCDYYLRDNLVRNSRHLYDIHKLLSRVNQDDTFYRLVKDVRTARAVKKICPSAQPGVDVSKLLSEICAKRAYEEDYNALTVKLLGENVTFTECLASLKQIASSGLFEE